MNSNSEVPHTKRGRFSLRRRPAPEQRGGFSRDSSMAATPRSIFHVFPGQEALTEFQNTHVAHSSRRVSNEFESMGVSFSELAQKLRYVSKSGRLGAAQAAAARHAAEVSLSSMVSTPEDGTDDDDSELYSELPSLGMMTPQNARGRGGVTPGNLRRVLSSNRINTLGEPSMTSIKAELARVRRQIREMFIKGGGVLMDIPQYNYDTIAKRLIKEAQRLHPEYTESNYREALEAVLETEEVFPAAKGHAFDILMGSVDFIPPGAPEIMIFSRLRTAVNMGAADHIPTRFVVLLLGSSGAPDEHVRVGVLLSDVFINESFHSDAWEAKDRTDLLLAYDAYLEVRSLSGSACLPRVLLLTPTPSSGDCAARARQAKPPGGRGGH